MSTRIRYAAGQLTHNNQASIGTGGSTITLPANTAYILIENMDASISLLVSFDGGTNFKTVKAGSALELDVDTSIQSLELKSASGAVAVEMLFGVEI